MVLPAVDSFEFSADERCLYYTAPDGTGRPSKVSWRPAHECQACLRV
jgi:hypothetical protein